VATFAGPIVAVGATSGQLTVAAHDRMRWVMDRRRTAAAQGDAASVVRQLVEQADAQGPVGLDVHAAPQSTPYTSTNILIGSDIESSDARWTARAGILQVGAAPFASSGVTLTEADWDEPPAVFVDGLGYASTIIGDTTYHVSPGMWGERAATLSQGDPRADYLARSTTWADTGETNGRGPRRLLSSNATDGDAAISLRSGVELGDWDAWRPGCCRPRRRRHPRRHHTRRAVRDHRAARRHHAGWSRKRVQRGRCYPDRMTDDEHARLVGELNDSLRRLAAWTEWLKRLQAAAAILLVVYQLCMGITTVVWPTRVFSPNEWRELSSWISIRVSGTALIFIAVIGAVSIARRSRRTLDFVIMVQSGIWASWSASLVWDAAAGHNWSISGAFGYGFMALIGLSVISPLTVGPANQHDG
jgi:hypothetical protein